MERVLLMAADKQEWHYSVSVVTETGMQCSSKFESRPMFPVTGYISRVSSLHDPYAEWLLERYIDSRVAGRFDWRNVQVLQLMAVDAMSFYDKCSSVVEAVAACNGITGLKLGSIASHEWIPSFINDSGSDDYKAVCSVIPGVVMDSASSFCAAHKDCGLTPLRVAAVSCAGVLRRADVLNRNTYRNGIGIARGVDYSSPTFVNIEFYLIV